jgi:hypothetical protein
LPSATDRPVLLSDGDFHPTLGAYSQAHFPRPFGPKSAVPESIDILFQLGTGGSHPVSE